MTDTASYETLSPMGEGITRADARSDQGRIVQTAEQAKVYRWLGMGMVAAGIISLLAVAIDPSSPGDFAPPLLMILVALYAAVRGPRCGARLSQQGVTVVNPFQRETARWEDIRAFSLGRYGPYPEMGFVELEDGGRIHIWGIQSKNPMFMNDDDAKTLVDQLNEALAEHRPRTQPSGSSLITPDYLPEHESFRRMVGDAHGVAYRSYQSLDEARQDEEAVAILQGDDGGQIYVVIPIQEIRCSAVALERLLDDLDAIAWPGNYPDMKRIFFEHQPVGSPIVGGMGGATATGRIWIHEEFRKMGLDGDIRGVIAGEIEHIRTSGRDRELP